MSNLELDYGYLQYTTSGLSKIASKALEKLKQSNLKIGSSVIGSMQAAETLSAIQGAELNNLHKLTREPSIAIITVQDQNAIRSRYFISRSSTLTGLTESKINLASYFAPIGQLASQDVGDEVRLPKGGVLTLMDKCTFDPICKSNRWDATAALFENWDGGPYSVSSFLELLRDEDLFLNEPHTSEETAKSGDKRIIDEEDLLSKAKYSIDTECSSEENRLTRVVIEKSKAKRAKILSSSLRDRALLDKYQDQVFRRELSEQIVLLGPPGSGKTTTLIKRLGMKLSKEALSISNDPASSLIESLERQADLAHSESWFMFTPTTLLKVYLKEAFSRENIPASDNQVKTWEAHRKELAKRTLDLLVRPDNPRKFKLLDSQKHLQSETLADPWEFFDAFDSFDLNDWLSDLNSNLEKADNNPLLKKLEITTKVRESIQLGDFHKIIESLNNHSTVIGTIVEQQLKEFNDFFQSYLNLQMNRNTDFLEEIFQAALPALLKVQIEEPESGSILEDALGIEDSEDETEITVGPENTLKMNRDQKQALLKQAIRAKAKELASSSKIRVGSANDLICKWLESSLPPEADLRKLGNRQLSASILRRFQKPLESYLKRLSRSYTKFRVASLKSTRFFNAIDGKSSNIEGTELDIIILLYLNRMFDLLKNLRKSSPLLNHGEIRSYQSILRNQIYVDEATDFSPIQLACMRKLCHPKLNSMFLAGDLNQRLTNEGTISLEALTRALPGIEFVKVNVPYRQSGPLTRLAEFLIGESTYAQSKYDDVRSESSKPRLFVGGSAKERARWIASEIREIFALEKELPTTAIFANKESEVVEIARLLQTELDSLGLDVEACLNGATIGDHAKVRVFAIEHVKGMEFEAAFFWDLSELKASQSDLFDKYLYVGVTRAAEHLRFSSTKGLNEIGIPKLKEWVELVK